MNLERLCQTLEARLERAIAQREELRAENKRLRIGIKEAQGMIGKWSSRDIHNELAELLDGENADLIVEP
jgi:hypothetical protein